MDIGESIWIVVKRVLDIPGMVYALLLLPLVPCFLEFFFRCAGTFASSSVGKRIKRRRGRAGARIPGRGRVPRRRLGETPRVSPEGRFKNLRLENLRLSGNREGAGSHSRRSSSHRALDDQMLVETEFPSPLPVELLIRRRRSLADFLRDRKAILSGDADILDFVDSIHPTWRRPSDCSEGAT